MKPKKGKKLYSRPVRSKDEIESVFDRLMGSETETGFEVFSDRVIELAYEPLNVGEMDDPDAIALVRGQCGDRMAVSIKIEEGKIGVIRFLTDGCGATVACGSAVTELAKGKTPWDARKIYPQHVIRFLDGLPDSHLHCAALSVQALRHALDKLEGEQSGTNRRKPSAIKDKDLRGRGVKD